MNINHFYPKMNMAAQISTKRPALYTKLFLKFGHQKSIHWYSFDFVYCNITKLIIGYQSGNVKLAASCRLPIQNIKLAAGCQLLVAESKHKVSSALQVAGCRFSCRLPIKSIKLAGGCRLPIQIRNRKYKFNESATDN